MKQLIALCIAAAFASTAFAAAPEAAPVAKTAQQSKMTTCNADAAGKKGDERKAFMKECLSAKPAPVVAAEPEIPLSQQNKMKKCNNDAVGKKGDERKVFMKACLSAK